MFGMLLAAASASATPEKTEMAPPQKARCLLHVDGRQIVNGPCTFTPIDDSGSFQILQSAPRYFAYVIVDGNMAHGYWNGTPKADHAHDPLGDLKKRGACWSNQRACVCAWSQ